tara:strand:+ start:6849 stop:7031 length:183 start_codon:yes stop_codon:yes gene_type:complete
MKTNFRKSEKKEIDEDKTNNENKDLTKEEFEEFIHKSGAKGSFMVYRSTKKDEELGIDEL